MSGEKKLVRSRGRPKSATEVQRTRLLNAAEKLLIESGSEINLRQVALQAEVTAPLAHYYFGNRDGLLRALLDERAAPSVDELLAAARDRAGQPVVAMTRLMQGLTLLLAGDRLVRRCLLLPAGETLRDRLRAGMGELLLGAQGSGRLRADLPASYLADTLLGLCLFAFLDSGTSGDSAEHAAALTLRHVALLQDGIVRARKQVSE